MSERIFYFLQIASTLSVLIPLIAGVIRNDVTDRHLRYFLGFLFVGLVADLAGWYSFLTRNAEANVYIRNSYDLFEALFLFWFLSKLIANPPAERILKFGWLVLVPVWLLRFWYLQTLSIFKSGSEILIAAATCFCLLKIIEETEDVFRGPVFWIFTGIFFYCFTTFFIMGILVSTLSGAWYMHNLINIATNLIYAAGFLVIKKSQST